MNAIVKTKRSEWVNIFYLHIFRRETHFYMSPFPGFVLCAKTVQRAAELAREGDNTPLHSDWPRLGLPSRTKNSCHLSQAFSSFVFFLMKEENAWVSEANKVLN